MWTHTASHLPTSSAVWGQHAEEEDAGAGAIPQDPSPLTFLLVETTDLKGKARAGSAAVVLPPSCSTGTRTEHDARGHPRQRCDAYGRSQWAQGLIPAASPFQLSALKSWYSASAADPSAAFTLPADPFVAGIGGKGQAVTAKLLLEPLEMQTNTSDMLRSLLGGGRAKKK